MQVLTTGQVAKICHVAPATVSRWFDSGRLRGYRIPGSKDRRIPRDYLIRFLKQHGMPCNDLEDQGFAKVMLLSSDLAIVQAAKREFSCTQAFKLCLADSAFSAGQQTIEFHPDCVIVDLSIGQKEPHEICEALRRHPRLVETTVIMLLPDNGEPVNFEDGLVNDSFKKPFDMALLAQRVKTLVGTRKELLVG